jgi:3-hydroxyacyl-CoA dehydrogenase
MNLVELIPTPTTAPHVLDQLEAFVTTTLGKGVVRAKDTPNFVANRIGVANMLFTLIEAERAGLSCDVVDDLTGKKLGRASSGTYRTADVVGLDTLMHVVRTMHPLTNDPFRSSYDAPAVVERLIAAGWLGAKSGAGFYKKVGKDILRLDTATMSHVAGGEKSAPEIDAILKLKPAERLAALRATDHPHARFLWAQYRNIFHYCAVHLSDVAYSARDMDFALRWGFGWKEGPFETWQQAGWQQVRGNLAAGLCRNIGCLCEAGPFPGLHLYRLYPARFVRRPTWLLDLLPANRGVYHHSPAVLHRSADSADLKTGANQWRRQIPGLK